MDLLQQKNLESGFSFTLVQVLLLAIITAVVYSNTLNNQFVFDDSRIYLSPHVRITELDSASLVNAWQKIEPKSRPLVNTSFALNYYFNQYTVSGYHLVNIAIHIVTGVFLFFLLKATLSLPSMVDKQRSFDWIPFIGALIWLVHPVQTQSVTYIVQRMNSMAAMFYVIAVFSYVRGRLSGRWWLRLVCFGCMFGAGFMSLCSKEIAVTLPLFVFLYDWYFLQDLRCGWLKKYGWLSLGLAVLFLLGVVFFYLGEDPFRNLLAGYAGRDFTLVERLLTETRVVVFYLSLLFLPFPGRLNLDHDFAVSSSLLAPPNTFLSLTILVLLLGLAVFMIRKHRLLSFGVIWFLGNLVIESSFVPLEIVFDHRLYLPSMMLIPGVVLFGGKYSTGSYIKLVAVPLLILVLLFWTYQRNQAWADPVVLWADCVEKSPAKARVHSNLGVALKKAGRLVEAEAHFRETIRLDPYFFEAYNNMGNIFFIRRRFDEAVGFYSKAIEIKPNMAVLHVNLGHSLVDLWRLQEARGHYKKAMLLAPGYLEARRSLYKVDELIENIRKRDDNR